MSVPGSKSLTNRALVLAALAEGNSVLRNVLFADDTLVMLENLRRLGFEPEIDAGARTVRITGRGGEIPAKEAELFCGNSGTTIRFLTAMCALGHGRFTLDGIERMRMRPIGQLVELLHNLGVRLRSTMQDGFPPVEVLADGLPGGIVRFCAGQSSQFLSAVLQISPYARHEVWINLEGLQTSWPYVAMTMRLMDTFDGTPHLIRDPQDNPRQIVVPPARYRGVEHCIEPDASSAGYFLAAAALHPGAKITIEGLGKYSLQGDIGVADLLHRMGADLVWGQDLVTIAGTDQLEGIDADLLAMPDVAQTLAVVALFAQGPTTLRGLGSLRVKETDRLAALTQELQKLGAQVQVEGDTMVIAPPPVVRPATIATYDDHRMAMSFALVGTKIAGVVIQNVECVNKTYPDFFADLAKLHLSAE
jgi:3-phosphoshikimate 1-carboxyvinyltransferase